MKKTKKVHKPVKRRNRLAKIIVGIIIALAIVSIFFDHNEQKRVEKVLFSKHDVEKIPQDVKQKVANTTPAILPHLEINAPILLYHYVENVTDTRDTKRKSLNIPPVVFEKQIQTLQDDGYTFITPSELVAIINGTEKSPVKPVILSFDDGYKDFYTNVFPLLKKYQVKSVAYIITGFLNKPNFMTDNEVKEIAASGLVEIGAHTVHHIWLKKLDPGTAMKEIKDSKDQLNTLLGIPIYSFAYPYGAFDSNTMPLVEGAGLTNAVSTIPGITQEERNLFFMYRVRPGYRIGNELLNYLAHVQNPPFQR